LTDPIIDFSDGPQPDPPAESATRRRGRPRSPEAVARDEQVLTALKDGPLSKAQLVEQLQLQPQHVYLSLWRLRREGRVVRESGGAERHSWRVA
jgi:predicted Rossmann fold nucleotide-binding protein DprA/Smf involved in DNA uptake